MKSRGLGGATAAAACIEGSSGEGMFVAGVSDGCLRVYSVSFSSSAQADLLAKVAFTELAFLSGPNGSEAHVCEFNISSGVTCIVSTNTDGSITVWENTPPQVHKGQ